jgi:hypothetical protein
MNALGEYPPPPPGMEPPGAGAPPPTGGIACGWLKKSANGFAQHSHATARPELGEVLYLRARLLIHGRNVILETECALFLQRGAAVLGLVLAEGEIIGALLRVKRVLLGGALLLERLRLALPIHLYQRPYGATEVGEYYAGHYTPPFGLEKAAQLEDACRL